MCSYRCYHIFVILSAIAYRPSSCQNDPRILLIPRVGAVPEESVNYGFNPFQPPPINSFYKEPLERPGYPTAAIPSPVPPTLPTTPAPKANTPGVPGPPSTRGPPSPPPVPSTEPPTTTTKEQTTKEPSTTTAAATTEKPTTTTEKPTTTTERRTSPPTTTTTTTTRTSTTKPTTLRTTEAKTTLRTTRPTTTRSTTRPTTTQRTTARPTTRRSTTRATTTRQTTRPTTRSTTTRRPTTRPSTRATTATRLTTRRTTTRPTTRPLSTRRTTRRPATRGTTRRPRVTSPARVPGVTYFHNGVKTVLAYLFEGGLSVDAAIANKPHIFCHGNGITFTAVTWFPFKGKVYAKDRADVPQCTFDYRTETRNINVTFPYRECGVRDEKDNKLYSVEVVLELSENPTAHTTQTFTAQCVQQKFDYPTLNLPIKIEEALEELNITPVVLERRAKMPECRMRIVPESEGEHHTYGQSEMDPISIASIGEKLRVEWTLFPKTEAFGFLIRNCTVTDQVSGRSHQVLDQNGCSNDINIFGHPHYDVYHDLAIVHWHAFKVPDNALLSFSCDCFVCSDIEDDRGTSSCQDTPAPPFCPEVEKVTHSPNSIFFDLPDQPIPAAQSQRFSVGTEVEVFGDPDTTLEELRNRAKVIVELDQEKRNYRHICMRRGNFFVSIAMVAIVLGLSIALSISSCVLYKRAGERLKDSRLAADHSLAAISWW